MKLRRLNAPEVRGFLDDGTELIGDLKFLDILHLHGQVKGRVISQGELVVGESGIVEGDVEVGALTLSGTIHGNITAARKVHILSTGRIHGDVCTPILKVDEGASWQGTIKTEQQHVGVPGRQSFEHESGSMTLAETQQI